MKMGTDDRRTRAGRDIDNFEFEPRPLTRPGFELLSRRPVGSALRSRYPNLVHLMEGSPAQARTAGRVEGVGARGVGTPSGTSPRPVLLLHTCEGGDCDMKRRDYYGPRLAEQVNGEDPVTDDQESDEKDASEQDQ